MYVQTNSLVASLPVIAPEFEKHDVAKAQWRVVRWQGVVPSEVTADKMQVVGKLVDQALDSPRKIDNEFPSRTAALRASERSLRDKKEIRSEKGHWGVWEWEDAKKVKWYQSVLPFAIAVAEEKSEVAGPVAEASASK